MKKLSKKLVSILVMVYLGVNYVINAFATSPGRTEVETVATDGIELFFGALGGIAVIMGGVEFWQAFMAYRENNEEGGSGEANSRIGKKILSGVLCLIGAVIVFVVMNWTKTLFDLD